MVKFLIHRPIGVFMVFVSIVVMGIASMYRIPVSLMPDVDIPEITIKINYKNATARELKNTIVDPVQDRLLQVTHLKNIESETTNGYALIRIAYEYGTDIDLAYIEANEKIDAAMEVLPKDMKRPVVMKASAADIPVFHVHLTLKNKNVNPFQNPDDFLELSEFSETVIRKRIEQLEEVAMVDVSGILKPQLHIIPDNEKIHALQINYTDIENIIISNNLNLGNIQIKEDRKSVV